MLFGLFVKLSAVIELSKAGYDMKNKTDRGRCFPQWRHTPVRHLKSRMILRRTLLLLLNFLFIFVQTITFHDAYRFT